MLTPAERNSLLLSLGFLLLGGGIKAWKKWHVELGPFNPATATSASAAAAATPGDTALLDTSHAGYHADSSRADASLAVSDQDEPKPARLAITRKPARHGTVKPPKTAPACPVDLNSASEARLANLPGVGPRTSAALAEYRKAHGPLRDIRELLNVKGIGEKKLALIAPCLILSGAGPDTLPTQASVDPDSDGNRVFK